MKVFCQVTMLSLLFFSPVWGAVEVFPQFAAGPDMRTSYTVHNPGEGALTLTVELFRTADLGGGKFFSEDVELSQKMTRTLEFRSEQAVIGWARLSSDRSFTATSFLQLYSNGGLAGQVGVLPAEASRDFKVFGYRDLESKTNTGIAVANPSSTDSVEVMARQLDHSGAELATSVFVLEPEQHLARNINEPPFFEGTGQYEGTVEFETSAPIVTQTLRQDGLLTTSTPVMQTAAPAAEVSLSSPLFGPGGLTIGGPAKCRSTSSNRSCSLFATLTGPEEPLSRRGMDLCFTIESLEENVCSAELQISRAITSSPQTRKVTLGTEFGGSYCDSDVTSATVVRASGAPRDCLLSIQWRADSIEGR
ncbi:MAG: hypothetical protein JSU96_00715 [Acidobacteriota bacterium]|nr:MAG: hypothetical protein JSU96_00715 [Acidobacteriota bacterium]